MWPIFNPDLGDEIDDIHQPIVPESTETNGMRHFTGF
jgi:hypothetical protein